MLSLRELLFGSPMPSPEPAPPVFVPKPGLSLTQVMRVQPVVEEGPWQLPTMPPGAPVTMAMDRATSNDLYTWAASASIAEGVQFLGFPYLAQLSQRPEYRRISEVYASESTRKWIKLIGDEERCNALEEAMKRFDVRGKFREAAEHDGFFGRSHIYLDLGDDARSVELSKPLMVVPEKIEKGGLKNLKVVEPMWVYPLNYESTNPLDPMFYCPQLWTCMGMELHRSRLLTMVGREAPDILKPAYAFGGVALSQMAKPYVDNWIRARQSVSDLLHSFSTMVLSTDLGTILQGGGADALIARAELFNRTRDNRGLFMLDKGSEVLSNISTPLGTLDKLLAQAQEQIASVTGIPLVVLLGVTPSGLNASSDGEVRTWYATVKAYQERVWRKPLHTVLDVLQLNEFGEIDPEIGFEFVDLWEMDETAKAAIRKSDADADVAYVAAGVVSNDEVRERIVEDEGSPYFGMDLSAPAPEAPDDEDDLAGLADEAD